MSYDPVHGFDRDHPDYWERTYAVTPQGHRETLVDTFVLDRRNFPNDDVEGEALRLAYALAKASGQALDIHAHNQWWAPIYTIHPDGSGYRHATGRKAGPFHMKEES